MLDFRDYKTASRYAAQINAGYSARLNGSPHPMEIDSGPGSEPGEPVDFSPAGQAFMHGWEMADESIRERGK